jgi:hypothetical protein
MQKLRRDIPFSAFLAAQAACRSLARIESPASEKPLGGERELARAVLVHHEEDDDVVVMTIN